MNTNGKSYLVQGIQGIETVISILSEDEQDYQILMTSTTNYGTNESQESLSRDLFESCLRTGYLKEIIVHNKLSA